MTTKKETKQPVPPVEEKKKSKFELASEAQNEAVQKIATRKVTAITTVAEFEAAGVVVAEAKAQIKSIDEVLDPFRQIAYDAYQKAMKRIKELKAPLEALVSDIVAKQRTFLRDQEKKREEEEKRIAEEKRKADEAAAAAAAETVQDQVAGGEVDQVAADLEAEGLGELAQAMREEKPSAIQAPAPPASVYVPPVPSVEVPKADGRTFKKKWRGTVTDKRQLIAAVATGRFPLDLLDVNQVALNRFVDGCKGTVPLPGVTFSEE